MRRLLRRSISNVDGRKPGSRGRLKERPVSDEAGSQADGGHVRADTDRLRVPELHRGCETDDVDEQLKVTDLARSRSLSRRLDQQSDCSCEAGDKATDAAVRPRRWRVLERQDELSSGTSSVVGPGSSWSSFERFRRQRASLRSFRVRSEQFLRQRMRPSCLRRAADSDDTYGPARRRRSDVGLAAVGGWLAAPRTVVDVDVVDGCDYEQQWLGDDATSSHTRQSSDVASSVDAPVWSDHVSSLESSPSTPFPGLSHHIKTRSAYRRALTGIVNPIGCADDRPGFSPVDLAGHLRDVFQYDVNEHSLLVEQIKQIKPRSNVVVKVNVIEAKELRSTSSAERCTPYCILDLVNTRSPKSSPNESPRVSPVSRRRSSKVSMCEPDELYQTKMLEAQNGDVKWDEKFEIASMDVFNDELHVSILCTNFLQRTASARRSGFKNLLQHLRLSIEAGRNSAGFLGHFRVPLKEIPAGGCDCWFSLYRDKKNRSLLPGRCRLRLQLVAKKGSDSVDGRNDDVITDYHMIVRQLYMHALTDHNSVHLRKTEETEEELFELLPERSSFIIDQFVAHHDIDDLTQRLIHLAVMLEMKSDPVFHRYISESFIKDQISLLQTEYDRVAALHASDRTGVTNLERMALQKTILDESLSSYLNSLVNSLKHKGCMPTLFPPKDLQLEELNYLVSNAVNLLCLPIWSMQQDTSQPRQEFSAFIAHRLQECVRNWVQSRLDALRSADADPVLPLTKQFISVLRDTAVILTPLSSISQYFARLGLNYYKIASMACDSKLSSKAQQLTLESDRYQITYNRFGVNIRESSIITLEHYCALRTLHTTIRGNVSERELFRISISNYQDWFKVAITFWLQTFREECMRRIEKALEIEKDVVQVTCLVKYSNSVVDVLSCFAKMTSEWRDIDFADADISLLGVTKITDTICDCVKLYLEKVINVLESNGYYDYIDNQQFDVTDQLCITLNNISHLSGYLSELSSLLHWDIVAQQLSITHENEAVGQTALQSLASLVAATNEDVKLQSRVLSQQIIEKIVVDLKKYTIAFTRCHNDLPSDVDPLLDYLENNLKVLYKKLEATIYPLFSEEILKAEIIILLENLEVGQAPSYYEKILAHAQTISNEFYTGGMEAAMLAGCKLSRKLITTLQMNSMSSDQLMLLYYKSLLNSSSSSQEYFGDVVVKVGYRTTAEGIVSIYVNVVEARNLPGMSTSDVSCPFVSVELCPLTMFPSATPHRTQARTSTVNPVYEEKFEFTNIAEEFRSTSGTVIIFSVWHREPVLFNAFLGEVVIPLRDLRELTAIQTVDDLPAVMMQLRHPKEPRDGPYKVLKERCDIDKVARLLLEQRNRTVAFGTRCRLCRPVKTIVTTITGKKLEVVGRKGSVCTTDSGRTATVPNTPIE